MMRARRSRLLSHTFLGLVLVSGLGLAVTVQGVGEWDLATPAPVPATEGLPAKLDRLDELSCTECHVEVVEEWATTQHALAWVDGVYQEEIKGRRKPESCHGCHIPELMHDGPMTRRPKPRSEDLHFGVSCESCHLGPEGEMLGPHGTPTDAHPSKKSETMIGAGSNELCSSCHRVNIGPVIGIAKDFERARLTEQGISCVECHMAPVERRWANLPEGAEGEEAPIRLGRSHALQTPRDPSFLRQAFEYSAAAEGGKTVVTLRNRASHRIPGLVGRALLFEAQLVDADGKVLAEGDLEITTRAHVPMDGSVTIELEGSGAAVVLKGIQEDPLVKDPVPFLDLRLEP